MKNRITGAILAGTMLLTVGLTAVACSAASGDLGTDIPPGDTQLRYWDMVEDFVANSSTFKFDGIEGSLVLVNGTESPDDKWEFTVEYQTAQPGHGDRAGQVLAQVITDHAATIKVENGQVVSAVCDDSWDIVNDEAVIAKMPARVTLGTEFTLQVGETVNVAGADLVVKFVGVSTDSRSPKGAETIWAGEAKAQLQITDQGTTSDVTLTEKGLTAGYTQQSWGAYNIRFQLQPYPEVGKQPTADEYQLLITISK